MTEAEWLDYADPDPFRRVTHPMLVLLESIGRVSERKLRLFAVACCRLLLRKVCVHPWYAHGVNVAERYADGAASAADLQGASGYPPSNWLIQISSELGGNLLTAKTEWSPSPKTAISACWNAAELEGGIVMADCAAGNAAWAATQPGTVMPDDNGVSKARFAVETVVQCDLIRCIFGNPFRSVAIEAGWQTTTIVAFAQAVYNNRDFDCLPILADALEEAGCTDAAILEHCRPPGPHVRGCWAIDLCLGLS